MLGGRYPVDVLAIDGFGDGKVRHRGSRRGAMSMTLPTSASDDITCANCSARGPFAPSPTHARQYHQHLALRGVIDYSGHNKAQPMAALMGHSVFLMLRDRKNGQFAAAGCPVQSPWVLWRPQLLRK